MINMIRFDTKKVQGLIDEITTINKTYIIVITYNLTL